MKDARKYQRYAATGDIPAQFNVILKGKSVPVRLVDFSLGGFLILSKIPFSPGTIKFSVDFGNRGEIALTGTVVRVIRATDEEDMWSIAIDLSKTYGLQNLRKI